ncbi:protein arginine N-methyltransferase [Amylostereum chailletii]|nr:protein arginine N-methyltransferase [Amylostereum chailletii]
MSHHIPASSTPVVSDNETDTDSSAAGPEEEEETWSDWVSDSEQPCKSLFEDKTLPSVADALAHDQTVHGFDLQAVSTKLALDFHGRIRLINYIRKENASASAVLALNGDEPFLAADEYLVPALEDDPLLLHQTDDWSDSDDDAPAPTDLAAATKRIKALERKLAQTQQGLVDYKNLVHERLDVTRLQEAITASDASLPGPSPRDDDTHYFESYGANDIHAVMIQDKIRTSTYASFILTNPAVFRDAIVLDVGCETGILSLFAARAGAKHVFAVDASNIAVKARRIVKANDLEDVITVIQGKVEDITLPDGVTHVDIIISEWMGYALLYESMLDSVLRARDRFLKPEGVMAPSQCKMMLGLCDASEIFKERIAFWTDIYGYDLSAMAEEVYDEAVVDVVGPDTMMSEPQEIKDLYLRDIAPRQLDFVAPFTLVSTAERKTKVHALVLYFDTFFTPDGERVPPETKVQVTREGAAAVAEVWPINRRPSRRESQSTKSFITSFSTGPQSVPTHWKHTLFLLREPILVEEGTNGGGRDVPLSQSKDNVRELDVEIHYSVRENVEASAPKDAIVQIFKVR